MPSSLSPSERSTRASIAANTMHAQGKTNTRPATEAFLARFLDEVDPDRVLTVQERERRAEHAKRAYMAKLALRSAKARRLKGAA